MTRTQTMSRVAHDLGAAVWLGGSLMGAVGLNGASKAVTDVDERSPVASAGWARWAPVNAVAIGAHLLGGASILLGNVHRVQARDDVKVNTYAKLAVTAAALGATAWSGALGAKLAKAGRVPAESGVIPTAGTPLDVRATQQQLRALQWVIPSLTAVIVGLASQQGEQQREEMVEPIAPAAAVPSGLRGLLGPVLAGRGGQR